MNHAAFKSASVRGCIGRTVFAGATLGLVLMLASCNQAATGPHATVLMKDGSTVTGSVTASSPSEITLAGDDKTNHTIPMTQVKSIEYDDTSAPAAASQAAGSASGSSSGGGASAPALKRRAAARASDAAHENHYHPSQAEVTTKTYVVPAGTKLSVRNEDTINSATAVEGQTYAAEITDDVLDQAGDVVIPHGSNAQIVIRSASKGGHFRGASDLVLDLQSISVDGQQYNVSTTDLQKTGKQGFGANKRTAEYTGGGAALGAIIGAIAGHGKGAAIGAGAGAGGGALTQILTKGGSIKVPSETVLTFQLDQPVQIVEAK